MAADTAFNVLLLGETGTGKEVVARLLHEASTRNKERFVKVNCAALPQSLLESELFGYEKGAFTGAVRPKPGKFELASSGIIFLDEIGDMPMVLQVKLLHVLQSGEFNRLGGTRDIKVNAWIISSTNHDLQKAMGQGLFREDLYYRLNIIKIEMPPLRDRIEDIPALTNFFLQKHVGNLGIKERIKLDGDLPNLFQTYHWPGNVRELSSTILKLLLENDSEKIKSELLRNMEADGLALQNNKLTGVQENGNQIKKSREETRIPKPLKDLKAEATRFIERKAILHALNMTGWNKRKAAALLKISYKALFYKMDAYGIKKLDPNNKRS